MLCSALCFRLWEVISNNKPFTTIQMSSWNLLLVFWEIAAPLSELPNTLFCLAIFIWLDWMVLESGLGRGVEEYWRNKNKEQDLGRILVPELPLSDFILVDFILV